MTGRLDWRLRLATVTSFSRGPGVLAAVTLVAMAMAGLLALATIDPPPAPVRRAKASSATPTPPTPTPAAIAVPPPAEPPPVPTAAELAASGLPGAAATSDAATPASPADWAALPIEQLRSKANLGDMLAMEELARRLVQGAGVAKDPQAGAGWLLRAAQQGSPQAAFNVGVMHERGFVVERDSTRAVEWYRKAADADLPVAKHNLALLLRDGKGAPRNGKEAIELLRSAARQGMAASMFSLGDIYERGDAAAKDPAAALAWFAITAEFERQLNGGGESALAKTALQRSQALQRVLLPAELERAQQLGQNEFRQIVEALAPPKPAPPPAAAATPPAAAAPPAPPSDDDLAGWPKAPADQVRTVQQALFDLKLLRDKPDGVLGPMTRNAIRDFQKSAGLRESGEPTREVYAALKQMSPRRDIVAASPLPPPKAVPAKSPPAPDAPIDLGKPEPAPPPPTSVDIARAAPPVAAAPTPPTTPAIIDLGKPQAAPPPPTSAEFTAARTTPSAPLALPRPELPKIDATKPVLPQAPATMERPKTEAAPGAPLNLGKPETPQADAEAWPTANSDQVKAIQRLLHDLKIYRDDPHGKVSPATRVAIREYQRMAGLKETGEASKALYDSLKEMRTLMVPKPGGGSN